MQGKLVVRGGFASGVQPVAGCAFTQMRPRCISPNHPSYGLTSLRHATRPSVGGSGVQYGLGSLKIPLQLRAQSVPCGRDQCRRGCPPNGATIEVYGDPLSPRIPMKSYLFPSFEVQRELPKQWVLTAGYQGAFGTPLHSPCRPELHLPTRTLAALHRRPFFAGRNCAQVDSVQSYKRTERAPPIIGSRRASPLTSICTLLRKSLDQVSNGDSADSNANQTGLLRTTTPSTAHQTMTSDIVWSSAASGTCLRPSRRMCW